MLQNSIIDRFIASAKNLLGFYWERSISILTYRVNWNKSFWCYVVECISYWDVEAIISIYINLVKTGKIPEYDVKYNYNSIPIIINEVYKIFGKNKDSVDRVLKSLYYATLDGTLPTSELLRPVTYAKNKDIISKPDGLESEKTGFSGFVSDLLSTIRILIIILLLAGAGIASYYIYSNFIKS